MVVAAGWIFVSRHGVDPTGSPLGNDFVSFWSAGRLITDGAGGAAPYDEDLHAAVQHAAFPTAAKTYTPFPYPPTFLFVCTLLGLAPYLAALAGWIAATGWLFWRAVRTWIGGPGFTVAIIAYPAVAMNAAAGQTGFLAAALFGAGAWQLQRRPWLAGVLFGALTFKPHFGLLIPVALVASRNWRAVAGAVLCAVALGSLAGVVFGWDAWAACLRKAAEMQAIVERGLLHPGKLVTAFGAMRVLGAPLWAAYAVQAVVAAAAAEIVAALAWRRPASPSLGAVLVAASLLPSPYLLFYDLTLAAVPLAWLLAEGRRTGFLRWEKVVMLAAFVLPLITVNAALHAAAPLAPVVLIALFAVCVRRAWGAPL